MLLPCQSSQPIILSLGTAALTVIESFWTLTPLNVLGKPAHFMLEGWERLTTATYLGYWIRHDDFSEV